MCSSLRGGLAITSSKLKNSVWHLCHKVILNALSWYCSVLNGDPSIEWYLCHVANNITANLSNQSPQAQIVTFHWQGTIHFFLMMILLSSCKYLNQCLWQTSVLHRTNCSWSHYTMKCFSCIQTNHPLLFSKYFNSYYMFTDHICQNYPFLHISFFYTTGSWWRIPQSRCTVWRCRSAQNIHVCRKGSRFCLSIDIWTTLS